MTEVNDWLRSLLETVRFDFKVEDKEWKRITDFSLLPNQSKMIYRFLTIDLMGERRYYNKGSFF